MNKVFGVPQLPLVGSELVTIQQMQNGQLALCTMPLSALAALFGGVGNPTAAWAESLPTAPCAIKAWWLNNGVLEYS